MSCLAYMGHTWVHVSLKGGQGGGGGGGGQVPPLPQN